MTHVHSPAPPAEIAITEALVHDLLASQLPHLAALPLRRASGGWDNEMFRLGGTLAVRLPRRQLAADFVVTELDWLPRMASRWTFPAPTPVAAGRPGCGYPWRWSVVPWLAGTPALDAPLSPAGAADLGAALAQVHVPAPDGAPLNPFRSKPLGERVGRLSSRLSTLVTDEAWQLDADAALRSVTSADPAGASTWCHMDLHGNNVLSQGGRLAGIVDWGDSGSGDPATDLGQVAALLGPTDFAECARAYVRAGGPADPASPRVRAEAVYYGVTLAGLADPQYAAAGWSALRGLGLAELRGVASAT